MKNFAHLRAAFAQLRMGTRLSLAFGAVLLLTAAIGISALVNLAHVNGAAAELSGKWLPSFALAMDARSSMLVFRELELKHANAKDASYMAEYEDKLKLAGAAVAKSLADSEAHALEGEERKSLGALKSKWAEYQGFASRVMNASRAGKADDAKELADGASKMALDEAVDLVDRYAATARAGSEAAGTRSAEVYARTRWWTMGLMAAALAIGCLMCLLITRGLLRQLGGEPSTAVAVARAVASGDLSSSVPLRQGDRHSLMAELAEMQNSLARVVASVRTGSEQVATASSEIASGNSDLSGRTEQQAASLQQTAASMEQFGSTVRRNADNAVRADQLANGASEVARRGGTAVSRVVETMRGINESSRRIADIIGVIDGIAFQTNILALNAAVEAARAGEQGRGFAVVAGEVRSLAQRSSDAAREIKALIAASVERVEQGTAQVDEAGSTMNEVVDAIAKVTAIVTEISAASREQSAGVVQVGNAVTQMDQATQQNATLVEQSATAAERLRTQAQELVDVVSAFRLIPA